MSHSSKASVVDQFLKAGQISSASGATLLDTHTKRLKPMVTAAGWHGPNDIKTLDGLGGNYLWSEQPQVMRMSMRFDAGHLGSQGHYEIINGLITQEQGMFNCVPNNPAIGWAALTLVPSGGAAPRSFVVAGMVTDADWQVEILLLEKLGAQGPLLPAFSAIRIL